MKYNLTEKQRELAMWIVQAIRSKQIPESFLVTPRSHTDSEFVSNATGKGILGPSCTSLDLLALEKNELLFTKEYSYEVGCTATGLLYEAVDSNFAEDEEDTPPISTLAQPHPPEIAMSLDRLRTKYPDPKKLGFLVMRFAAAKPFSNIVEVIKQTRDDLGLTIVRADEHEFHGDLWGNVRTHLHGCGFGIAVYERIETNEPNANVGLEVGYLLAMNKPVLLLKDKTVPALQPDLAGKLYKNFDPHDPAGTIPEQMTKWLVDNGVILSTHPGTGKVAERAS